MSLFTDTRHVVRELSRARGPTSWAVLLLALGIGATAAIFGLVNAVLLRPLPYRNPDRLVVLWQTDIRSNEDIIPWGNFLDYQQQTQLFRGVAAFGYWTPVLKTGTGRKRLIGAVCTANLFSLLGVSPLLGRTFQREEQGRGVNHVLVLSYALWRRDLGSDPHVIGRDVVFEQFGTPVDYTVVGVMPAGFEFPHPLFQERVEAWSPMGLGAADASRRGNQVYALAGLRPGVSVEQAQTRLSDLASRLAELYPATNRGVGIRLAPLAGQLVHNVKALLLTLSAAVIFILVLSCASVSGLIVTHAWSRSQQTAVRAALGAPTWELVRPPIIEGVLLAMSGWALGIAVARVVLATEISRMPADLLGPRLDQARVDGTVLAFGLALAVICGICTALVAAVRSCRLPLGETLKQGGRSTSAGRSALRLHSIFAVIQISAAFVLLAGAGLMIRSFIRLNRDKLGFDTRNLLTFNISLPNSLAPGDRELPVLKDLLTRARALPGVTSAALADSFPLSAYPSMFRVAGGDVDWKPAEFHTVSPAFFQVLGVQLIAGRSFTDEDDLSSERVMIVNQEMARRLWPGQSPLGKRITVRPSRWSPEPEYAVIGEVSNVRPFGGGGASPAMFVPFAQFAEPDASVVVRAKTEPDRLVAPLRALAFTTDAAAMAEDFVTAEQLLANSTRKPRVAAQLLGTLAFIALIIAIAGVYSVVSLRLRLQLRAVGIRLALGAPGREITAGFLRTAFRLALVAIAAGLIASLILDHLLVGLLYGLSPADFIALGGAGLILLAGCLLATLPIGLSAANVNPALVLREE